MWLFTLTASLIIMVSGGMFMDVTHIHHGSSQLAGCHFQLHQKENKMFKFKLIIGALAGITAAYLLGAFVSWDFNAGNWEPIWRGVFGICFFPMVALAGAVIVAAEDI